MSPGNGCEEFMTDWSVVCADRKLTARHRRDVGPQINKLCINISSSRPGMCYQAVEYSWAVLSFFSRSFFHFSLSLSLHRSLYSWRLFAAVTHFTWWLYWGYREWRQIDYLAEQERSGERDAGWQSCYNNMFNDVWRGNKERGVLK